MVHVLLRQVMIALYRYGNQYNMKQVIMKRKIYITIIIFVGSLSVLNSILDNLTPRIHPKFALAFQYSWILFMSVTMVLIVITALQYLRMTRAKQSDIQRQRLMSTANDFWITGVLD